MSRGEKIESPPPGWERRYEIIISKDDAGLEQLTIARLEELGAAAEADVSKEQLADLACRMYDSRRARERYFHTSLFGEPVWDMLLALYCLESQHKTLSVTGLCHASGAPMTTGLRWSQLMEQKGLILREADPHDGRRVHLRLSVSGHELMSRYLTSIYHRVVVI